MDWVKNLLKDPVVSVRIGGQTFSGTARLVQEQEEDRVARLLVAQKYHEMDDEQTPDEWARTALPVAIDFNSPFPSHLHRTAGAVLRGDSR